MTMALAIALVACQAATPAKAGDKGEQGPAGDPAPMLPYLEKGFADVELAATGAMATTDVDLAGRFVDPHKGQLTYSASADPADVVDTSVTGSTLTLTAMKEGTAKVTVTAKNKDGVSAYNPGAVFNVTVMKTVPPMVAEGGIPDQDLYKADGAKTIQLTKDSEDSEVGYFYHPKTITYTASASPTGFVTVAEADGVLTLTPLVTGQAIVTITATAESKSAGAETFTVNIHEGSAPVNAAPVAAAIPAQSMMTGDDPLSVDVSPFFSDADDDALTFSNAVSSDTMVATVELSGSTLTITAVAAGTSTISVTATDPDGESVTGSVELTVSEPVDENVAPVVSTIPAQSMMTGDGSLDVDVSSYFSDADGDELTFSNAVSSNTDVATVEMSASTLTITAVAAGVSTISVTASDPDGESVTGSLELTVSAPDPTMIPDAVDLAMRKLDTDGDTEADVFPTYEQEFTEGYTLQTKDSSIVNVVRTGATDSGNQWRLTARSKGSTTVYVNDANNVEAGQITVTVLNSPPLRKSSVLASRTLLDLAMQNEVARYTDASLYNPVVTHRILYRTPVTAPAATPPTVGLGNLRRFYTDADGDSLSFVVEVQDPHKGLILFKEGSRAYDADSTMSERVLYEIPTASPTDHVIYADILTERVDRPIGISIYAFDGDDKSAASVDFELRNKQPIARNDQHAATPIAGNPAYLLTQLQEPGFFRNEKYGNRTGVDHIFKFGHSTKMVGSNRVLGFTFAHDFLERLVEDGFTISSEANHTLDHNDHLYGVSSTVNDYSSADTVDDASPVGDERTLVLGTYTPTTLGAIYYDFKVEGPITQSSADKPTIQNFVQGGAETLTDPVALAIGAAARYPEIKFRFNAVGIGMLTITFGVWADEDGTTGPKTPGWQTESRRVDFEIIGCTSVELIEDCP